MCIDMRNGNFSRYYNTYSIIHSMNPLCKLLALLIFVIMVMICSNIRVICGLSLILIYIVVISNIPLKKYLEPLWRMKVLFFFIFFINFLFGVSFYSSFVMICRVCLVVMYSSVLLYTTTTNEIALGVASLIRPFSFLGFSVSRVSMAIALALNFIPSLFLISNKIIKSQAGRGFNYRSSSFKNKLLGIKSVFIPMFILAIKRADCVSDAMELKQFSFNRERSTINVLTWHINDIYMIFCHILVLIFVLVKEVVL